MVLWMKNDPPNKKLTYRHFCSKIHRLTDGTPVWFSYSSKKNLVWNSASEIFDRPANSPWAAWSARNSRISRTSRCSANILSASEKDSCRPFGSRLDFSLVWVHRDNFPCTGWNVWWTWHRNFSVRVINSWWSCACLTLCEQRWSQHSHILSFIHFRWRRE